MPIADKKFFTKEHIETVHLNASTALAEQAIHCLELVAELSQSGLAYQFKGGNSLLLILDEPQRFSIDVDIATDEPRERIELCLDKLVKEYGTFIRWEKRQHKTKPWIPLASYYLFYNSHYAAPADAFIMLDAQLHRSPYATAKKQVSAGSLYRSNAQVDLPLPSSIVGDKLLTMGPATLGIPLGKGKEAQRLKHVYDVSTLLKSNPPLSEIRTSMIACMKHENALQEKSISVADVVNDTVAFCASVALYDERPVDFDSLTGMIKENAIGIEGFAAHLFAKGYDWRRLQTDMARVALCITAVGADTFSDGEFTDVINHRTNAPRSLPATTLNANPDARYYWEQVCHISGKKMFAGAA